MIGFGTVFIYRDIEIGDNVLIGMYNTIHHCDFGSYVLTAEGCRFLSGSRYHHFDRTDVPMALQGGSLNRILSMTTSGLGPTLLSWLRSARAALSVPAQSLLTTSSLSP